MATSARQHAFHDDPESVLPMNQGVDLQREWRVYAIRRNLALVLLFGWLPFCATAFYVSRQYVHLPFTAAALMVVWGLAMWAAIWWAGEFRCPRCRRRFGALGFRKGIGLIWRGLFDRLCANCKLHKFERT